MAQILNKERKMLRRLSALFQRLFPGAPGPSPDIDERPVELLQAAEEADFARKREEFWEEISKDRFNFALAAGHWARDVLRKRDPSDLPALPSRIPDVMKSWLRGLTVAQLDIVGRKPPTDIYNHLFFHFYADLRIRNLPKLQVLTPQNLVFPPPVTAADLDRGRKGGGPKGLTDLREVIRAAEEATAATRGMR